MNECEKINNAILVQTFHDVTNLIKYLPTYDKLKKVIVVILSLIIFRLNQQHVALRQRIQMIYEMSPIFVL